MDYKICLLVLVGSSNLLGSLATWGPAYRVSVEVKINSFTGPGLRDGEWAELLSFSATNNYEGNSGDRVPGVFSHRDGSILVATQVQGYLSSMSGDP